MNWGVRILERLILVTETQTTFGACDDASYSCCLKRTSQKLAFVRMSVHSYVGVQPYRAGIGACTVTSSYKKAEKTSEMQKKKSQ